MSHWRTGALALSLTLFAPLAVHAQAESAHAILRDVDGDQVGTAQLTQIANDGVLMEIRLAEVPAGTRALHLHETGACSPDFGAAGGHFAPEGHSHGILRGEDDHAGDFLNIHVPASEEGIVVERMATDVTLERGMDSSLLDEDGSAIIIHQDPDDYASQPSGAAGARIACGGVESSTATEH